MVRSVRASLWAGSPGLASTMMDLALSALTLARSAVSSGLPDLHVEGVSSAALGQACITMAS